MTFKRRILFIGGYDPKSSKHIYHTQKEELALYAERFGTKIQIGGMLKHNDHRISWSLYQPDQNVKARIDLLTWDDLVRQNWQRTTWGLIQQATSSLWEYVKTGRILHMGRLSLPLVCAAALPILLSFLALGFSVLAAWLLVQISAAEDISASTSLLIGATVSVVCVFLAYRQLQVNSSTWFMRVVAFARTYAHESDDSGHGTDQIASHRHRLEQWANNLSNELAKDDSDEILIVGYSAGSILAPSLLVGLAKVIAPHQFKKIALLTLGNCLPVAACLPCAKAIHHDLQYIAQNDFAWVDITSPADWGSVYGVDSAVLYAGSKPSSQRQALSPRFHLLFKPASYREFRKNKFHVHQQYLKCTELLDSDPKSYDFFAILCGSLTLAERYSLTSPESHHD